MQKYGVMTFALKCIYLMIAKDSQVTTVGLQISICEDRILKGA